MRVMQLEKIGEPLQLRDMAVPEPLAGQVRVKVLACGVCRTDLHVVDGDLEPHLPVIPGHEIVGLVDALGAGVSHLQAGQRIGIPWLGYSCGECRYCRESRENLCEQAGFTGYTINGGYAEYTLADARYCFPLPDGYSDSHAAPLLCAGLIGYRALQMAGDARRLGIYGFGAAAHIIAQVALHQGRELYAFTRPGDVAAQQFALELGVHWAGDSDQLPPVELDAALLFAPVGELVPASLAALRKGGICVCAGIHMSPIPAFDYDLLWGERSICSVANLTREDGERFFSIAAEVPIHTAVHEYSLEQANRALDDLRHGAFQGAAVLVPDKPAAVSGA